MKKISETLHGVTCRLINLVTDSFGKGKVQLQQIRIYCVTSADLFFGDLPYLRSVIINCYRLQAGCKWKQARCLLLRWWSRKWQSFPHFYFMTLLHDASHIYKHTPMTSEAVNNGGISFNPSVYNEGPVIPLHATATKPSSRLDISCAKGAAGL